jgi:hypothetical protein
VAWPLILAGTLLTAILALVSGQWSGWRKFAPLLVILSVPVMLLASSLTGGEAFSVIMGLAWIVLGLAVMTSEPAASFQAAQT